MSDKDISTDHVISMLLRLGMKEEQIAFMLEKLGLDTPEFARITEEELILLKARKHSPKGELILSKFDAANPNSPNSTIKK